MKMKATSSYVFYQTNKAVWLCPASNWMEYIYYTEIHPTRLAIVKCTQEWIEQLFSILACDKKEFCEILIEELNRNNSTLYMN